MNLIEYLDQDLHENSLDVLLGLSPTASSIGSDSEPQYDFGSGSKNCETYQWIWQDDNSDLDGGSTCEDLEICEMKEARSDQESRIKRFVAWVDQVLPASRLENICRLAKGKKRIRKVNRKNKWVLMIF